MTTSFPSSQDSFSRPTASSALTGHAALHDDLADAIEAIETKVGSNSSAVTTSHDYKIAQLETGQSASGLLATIKTVDGAGSGLDADTVDGQHASAFAVSGHNHDTVYAPIGHDHDTVYLGISSKAADSDKLDSYDSTQFLRSDVDASASGRITLAKTGMGADWTTAQLVVNPGSSQDAGIAIRTADLDQYTVQLRAGGTSASGPPRLFVTGDVGSGGGVVWSDIECRTVQENSARRFKDNIVSAYVDTDNDAIEKVKQIPLSSFNYLDNPSETVVGVVAEDLVDVLPEAVVYRDDEVSSVVTQRITYTALGALKQAINRIEQLEAQVALLQGA